MNSFKISFKGSGIWYLSASKGGNSFEDLMMVNNGVCGFAKEPISKDEFEEKFNEVFHTDMPFQDYDVNKIWEYIESAQQQQHGTMMVITKEAKNEARRLSNQSFEINKINDLSPELIIGLTSIDGAIIIDPKGYCHAIGAILDGVVESSVGDISRGARYNAASSIYSLIKLIAAWL